MGPIFFLSTLFSFSSHLCFSLLLFSSLFSPYHSGDSFDEGLIDSAIGKTALREICSASHAVAPRLAEKVSLFEVVEGAHEAFEHGGLPASLARRDATLAALFGAEDAATSAAAAAEAGEAVVADDDEGEDEGEEADTAAVRSSAAARAAAVEAEHDAILALHRPCSAALTAVGLTPEKFVGSGRYGASNQKKGSVAPKIFLNRLLSAPVGTQVALFAYFSAALARRVQAEKRAGSFDPGVAEIHCSPAAGGVGQDGLPKPPELWIEDPATGR